MRTLLSLLVCVPVLGQVAVPTAQYDNDRTNSNRAEQILNISNVTPATFGKLFVRTVDGVLYAEPLYLPGVSIPGKGTHNVVFCATMQNTVYAFDADDPSASTALWSINLGTPVTGLTSQLIQPSWGILSTPVIDPNSGTLYATARIVAPGGTPQLTLNALDIHTGTHKANSPALVQGSVSGSVNGTLVLDNSSAQQRVALLLANHSLYLGLNSSQFLPDNGWLLRYDPVSLSVQGAFVSTLNSTQGGIWQMGRGAAADPSGNVYVATANGDYDGVSNFSQSMLKFGPSGLSLMDWFTPADNAATTAADLDFGLNGPILIPGTNLVVTGGKDGIVYVMNQSSLGHLEGNGAPVQSFQASPYCGADDCYHQEALWARSSTPILYVWRKNDVVRSYRLFGNQFETTPLSMGSDVTVIPGAAMTVSSNGDDSASAILWSMGPVDDGRDTLREFGPMTVRAYNALDLTQELWNSSMNAARDDPGNYAKFAAPVVANGKVFVPTFSNQLVVYGLFSSIFVLNASVTPGNGGTVTATLNGQPFSCATSCSATGVGGAAVTLTATPAAGYSFGGWTGCASSNGTACTVYLSGIQNISATFSTASSVTYAQTALVQNRTTGYLTRTVTVKNSGPSIAGAAYVADGLPAGVTMVGAAGSTSVTSPAGSPYLALGAIAANGTATITVQFARTGTQAVNYTVRLISGPGPY